MIVQEGEYKGRPVLTFSDGEKDRFAFRFSFGLKKARLILEHIDAIEDFVSKHSQRQREESYDNE